MPPPPPRPANAPEPEADAVRRHWFDPAALYAKGFHGQIQTSLQLFPHLRAHLERIVAEVAPGRALEVGPGDRPLIRDVPERVYLDLSPALLSSLEGMRVRGDLLAAPFRADSFDLVVAADVLTHIPPHERPRALEILCALAPRLLLLVNEHGADGLPESAESIERTVERLEARGRLVQRDDVPIQFPSGDRRRYALLFALRRGTAARSTDL